MSPNTSQYYNLWWPKHMLLAHSASAMIFRNYISLTTQIFSPYELDDTQYDAEPRA